MPSRVEYLSLQGVLLPRVYGTIYSPLWLELRGPGAWQAAPSRAVCRHACHWLLPWLWVTFAMVPDADWPRSDQWPWSTAPATGPAGRLGRASVSDPGGVVCCALSLCCPWCVRLWGVLGNLAPVHRCARPLFSVRRVSDQLALVHRCARCVWYVCAVGGLIGDPPLLPFFSCFFFGALVFLCVLCTFFCFLAFAYPPLLFLLKRKKMDKGARAHCRHRHGHMVQRCSSAAFFVGVCVVGALSAVAPQGCGSRVLMYMGAG